MATPESFIRQLLERAIEDDLVAPSETERPGDGSDGLSYLHHVDADELAGVVGLLKRFIAAQNGASIQTAVADGHWSAWRAGRPETAFGGHTEREAVLMLLEASGEPCGECGGSGQYVGLQAVTTCQECHGRGRK